MHFSTMENRIRCGVARLPKEVIYLLQFDPFASNLHLPVQSTLAIEVSINSPSIVPRMISSRNFRTLSALLECHPRPLFVLPISQAEVVTHYDDFAFFRTSISVQLNCPSLHIVSYRHG